ncbi:PKD domain-containing protein, partial [bacterium]|nr:PKD domain-containing protein [bacterium]
DFGYAVDACWDVPDTIPVIDPVDDFPITANCNEAYRLIITIGDGLTTAPGSKAIIEVEVFDHQGHETIRYSDYDGVSIPSFSGRLSRLEGGDIWWSSPAFDTPHFEFSTATGEDSFLFTAIIEQELNTTIEEGFYPLDVYVSGTDEDPNLGTRGASHVIQVFIGDVNALPVAEALAYPVPQAIGKPVQFRDNGSYDPDGGSIVKWEWDWDMDGTFDDEGYFAFHWFDTPGTHYVNLRVTDNEGSSRTLFEPLEVTIKEGKGWARTWGGSYSDSAWNVAVDNEGNIYVVGYYTATTDFDPSPFLEAIRQKYGEDSSGFISKFGRDGQFKWVRTMGGP